MSTGVLCRQSGCKQYAAVKYTWPGRDQSAACVDCAGKLVGVARAIGLHVQLIPITTDEHAKSRLDSEAS